jgi:hypothetical protein
MMLGKQAILTFFTALPSLIRSGLGRVLGFFTSGWQSYFGMILFVVADHWRALFQGNFYQAMVEIGVKMGRADTVIAANLDKIPEASGLQYGSLLFEMIVAFFTVLWFLRTVKFILNQIWGDVVADVVYWLIAVLLWIIPVLYVTGDFPVATVELVINLVKLVDLQVLNPVIDTNSTIGNLTTLGNNSSL